MNRLAPILLIITLAACAGTGGKFEMREPEHTLSKEEREKQLKFIKDWHREFESAEPNDKSLDEMLDYYVEGMDAIVDLLSPKYQQRLDEIEASFGPLSPNYIDRFYEMKMSEELTEAEIAGITDELRVICEEAGIPMEDFFEDTADDLQLWMLSKHGRIVGCLLYPRSVATENVQ